MYKESTLKKQKVRRWKAGEVEPDRGLSVSVRSPQQKDSASGRERVVCGCREVHADSPQILNH